MRKELPLGCLLTQHTGACCEKKPVPRPGNAIPRAGESVADLHPHLVEEVDRDRVPPAFDLRDWKPASNTRIPWVCSTCGHRWTARIIARAMKGQGCIKCRDRAYAVPEGRRSLADLHPYLIEEFVPTVATADLTLYDVRPQSNQVLRWRCRHCDHEWDAPISNRAKGHGCRRCADTIRGCQNGTPRTGRTAADVLPILLAEIDEGASPSHSPHECAPSSNRVLPWKCLDCGHRWRAAIKVRTKGHGCPACAAAEVGRKNATPDPGRSAADRYPQAVFRVDRDLNPDLDLRQLKPNSAALVMQRCAECQEVFGSRVRAFGRGLNLCDACRPDRESEIERALRSALAAHYPIAAKGRVPCRLPQVLRKEWHVDVLSDQGFVVEYDGSYWHSDRVPRRRPVDVLARDRRKAADIRDQGWTVVRVREAPLTALHPHDLVVPTGADAQKIVPPLLERLTHLGFPPSSEVPK